MIDISLLNSVQLDAIEELRKRVENVILPDMADDRILYYKLLKARDFNLDKAEKMLRKNIEFRKHHQLSTLIENFKPKEFFLKFAEPSTIGLDKDGDIAVYCPLGRLDAKDVLNAVTMNDYMKHWVWYCEKWAVVIKRQREKEGKKSQQLIVIFDLNGLTFSNTTSKAAAETVVRLNSVFQDNYPESLKSMILINAPSYYVIIMSVLRPFMSAATLRKMQCYGQSGWKEMFLENFDADDLPAFLGGKRTDPDGDPKCKTFIVQGGWMPKSLYLTKEDRDFKDKSRVTKISVPYSCKRDIYFDVADKGFVIQWEFLVKSKDIRFGLFFQGTDNVVEILPLQKYETTDGVEKGSYKANFIGKHFITFDNTYSWLNSKEIEYSIIVLKN